jgi:hypothetical protein
LQRIKSETGAHVVVHTHSSPCKIIITGMAESIEAAKVALNKVIAATMKDANEVCRVGTCPQSAAGFLIGKGGNKLKRLQDKYDVHITLDNSVEPLKWRIWGNSDGTSRAKAEVEEIIAASISDPSSVSCSYADIACIMKSRERIRNIISSTGTSIKASKKSESEEGLITITGSTTGVEAVKSAVCNFFSVLHTVQNDGLALRGYKAYAGDKDLALAAIQANGAALEFVSTEYKADRSMVLKAIEQVPEKTMGKCPLEFASHALREDKSILLRAIAFHGKAALEFTTQNLRDARDVMLACAKFDLKIDGLRLQEYPEFKDEKDVVLTAVQSNGAALEFASDFLRNDRAVVGEALSATRNKGFEFASAQLRGNRSMVLEAMKRCGISCLQFASEELKGDASIIMASAAIGRLQGVLKQASYLLQDNRMVVMKCVSECGMDLGFASDRLKADLGIVLQALHSQPSAFRFASEELRSDKSVVLTAFDAWHRGKFIEHPLHFVPDTLLRDKDVVLAAVAGSKDALQFVVGDLLLDREVLFTALTHNGLALKFVPDQAKTKSIVIISLLSTVLSQQFIGVHLKDDAELMSIVKGLMKEQKRSAELNSRLDYSAVPVLEDPRGLAELVLRRNFLVGEAELLKEVRTKAAAKALRIKETALQRESSHKKILKSSEEVLPCSRFHLVSLIGVRLKQIERESGASIAVSNFMNPPQITISGIPECVEIAKVGIREAIQEIAGEAYFVLDLPAEIPLCLILGKKISGKKFAGLLDLSAQSGAVHFLSRSGDVHVKGTSSCVNVARRALEQKILDISSNVVVLTCPLVVIKTFIQQGVLQNIQDATGVHISYEMQLDPCPITIKGESQEFIMAAQAILKKEIEAAEAIKERLAKTEIISPRAFRYSKKLPPKRNSDQVEGTVETTEWKGRRDNRPAWMIQRDELLKSEESAAAATTTATSGEGGGDDDGSSGGAEGGGGGDAPVQMGLHQFVSLATSQCATAEENAAMNEMLHPIIASIVALGNVDTLDWSTVPLPALPQPAETSSGSASSCSREDETRISTGGESEGQGELKRRRIE